MSTTSEPPDRRRRLIGRTSDLFGTLDGGRVLDVGTGKGQFVRALIDELRSYTEIIGVDSTDAGADAFAEAFAGNPSVHFVQADAAALPFADGSFDTVAIAGSLHHVADLNGVLFEMRRVLRDGGAFIVGEQLRDDLTGAETTHLLFHEWSEEILAVSVRRTFEQAEILTLIGSLGLVDVHALVEVDGSDPRDPDKIAHWDGLIAGFLERVSDQPQLHARGVAIRLRLDEVGIDIAPALWSVGTKPSAPPARAGADSLPAPG